MTDRPLSLTANPAGRPECGPDNVSPPGCVKDLRTAVSVAPSFRKGNISFVALSNNHQIRYGGLNGSEGVRDTLRFFRGGDGVPHAGIGETAEEAARPATLTVPRRGVVTIFAILAGPGSSGQGATYDCEAGGGGADPQIRLASAQTGPGQNVRNLTEAVIAEYQTKVGAAAARGEVVVIFLHWGCNWDWMQPACGPGPGVGSCSWGNSAAGCPGTQPWGCDAARRQRFGRAMIDAGATVVWGTSSHHVQPVELYGDGVIIYGPGNVMFQTGFRPDTATSAEYHDEIGMLLQVKVEEMIPRSNDPGAMPRGASHWRVANVTAFPTTYTSRYARLLDTETDAEMLGWFAATMERICRPYNTAVGRTREVGWAAAGYRFTKTPSWRRRRERQ